MIHILLEILGIILIIIYLLPSKRKIKLEKNINEEFAIIIPARNEERVIKGLMDSLKEQTIKVNFKDVYVMVSDENDLSIPILKEYGCNILTRKNPELKRKGYALDETIKSINKSYDLYFIFDADNILDKNFIKYMLKEYRKGYDIAVSKRLNKNPNDSATACCSGLLFTILNCFNSLKTFNNENVILSGTGFYVSGAIINELEGFPFNTLTEDYELTLFSIINKYNTRYSKNAMFYDEQPIQFLSTIKQRTRWVKGYFENRKKYNKVLIKEYAKTRDFNILKEIIGIKGIILLLLGLAIQIGFSFSFKVALYILLSIYLVLLILTIFLLIINPSKLDWKIKYKALIFNPIFLLSYIVCLFKSFGSVSWDVIKHEKSEM